MLPITYVLHGGAIYSAVDSKRKRAPGTELARVHFLRERPQAAFTVDRYDDDWSKLAWVQALGRVQVLAIDAEAEAVAALVAKYEPYRERPPIGPLLRLAPERFLCWRSA